MTRPGKTQRLRSDSTRRLPTSTSGYGGFKLRAARNLVGFNTTHHAKVGYAIDTCFAAARPGHGGVNPNRGRLVSSRLRPEHSTRARLHVALPASISYRRVSTLASYRLSRVAVHGLELLADGCQRGGQEPVFLRLQAANSHLLMLCTDRVVCLAGRGRRVTSRFGNASLHQAKW